MSQPQTNPAVSSLPIGSVIAYGGDLSTAPAVKALNNLGWYVCDGSSLSQTTFQALFEAIGTANGGDDSTFNLPDLRNRFMRGTAGDAINVDPDTASRLAAAPGGAVGNNTGSMQTMATALPRYKNWALQTAGAHSHTCSHLNDSMHEVWNGSTYTMARWNATVNVDIGGAHFHGMTGFDPASRPINVALYFIIKASEPQTLTGTIPTAAIIGFAGTLKASQANWVKCDGAAYGIGAYPTLLNVILYSFGGDGVTVMNVPDVRGYFLRGTSHSTGRDPNASTRHASNTGGNVGDNIGSGQLYATISPQAFAVATAGSHSHNIALVPQTDHHAAWGASGPLAKNTMEWTNGNTTSSTNGDHSHNVTGGDKETRPENIYTDFLIATIDLPQSAPPIGAIMSFGGDFTDPSVSGELFASGWMPCNGSSLRRADFPELFSVIGTTFGQSPLKFSVPDLRGRFVMGAGSTAVGTVQTVSTTGAPTVAIVTSTDGDHQHQMYNIPTDTHTIDVVAGVDLAENNESETPTSTAGGHTHVVSGGDLESRPPNVNVDYIIRFK